MTERSARRAVLRWGSVLGATAVAGCSGLFGSSGNDVTVFNRHDQRHTLTVAIEGPVDPRTSTGTPTETADGAGGSTATDGSGTSTARFADEDVYTETGSPDVVYQVAVGLDPGTEKRYAGVLPVAERRMLYAARVRTENGVTGYRRFLVGPDTGFGGVSVGLDENTAIRVTVSRE